MDAKEKLLNVIEERLTVYANWVNQGGGIRSDASEDLYCELLNTAMGYDLRNMNWVEDNFPAIDLGDDEERLAVQVTSTGTADKVKKTLKRFYDHELNRDYDRLIVLIAGKAEYKPSKFDHPGVELEIWGTAELIQELRRLSMKVLRRVEAFLLERVDAPQMRKPRLHMPVPERRSPVGFLGREKELAELRRRMDDREKPVILAGLGGVGKTMLASHFARKWPGNALFVRFDGSFTRTLVDGVGRHIPPEQRKGLGEEAVAELALELLGQYGADDLLIVDNAEVPGVSWRELTKDPCYAKLRELPMKQLMTTRNRDTGGLWIGNLEDEELREIFRRHDAGVEEPMMDALIRAVGGHTMTVDMIARTIRESWGDVTAADILTAMKDSTLHAANFDEIENDHDPEQRQIYAHLKALFDLSGISADGRQALRCATLLPQDGMDAALFRNALPEGARDEIKKLEKRGWVDLKNGLVKIHPVVRLVCRTELVPTNENCREFLRGIQGQYDRKQYSAAKFRQMAGLFETASEVLEDRNGFWTGEAGYFWGEVAEYKRALSCNLRAVEKQAKQPNAVGLATSCNNVGLTYSALGEHGKALMYQQKALAIREKVLPEDHPDLATSYDNVGGAYGVLGDHGKELEYQLKALMIREKILPANHLELAISYNNVGLVYGALGDHDKTLEYMLKAIKIQEKVLPANHPYNAFCYNNMGITYGALGDHGKALEYQLKALAIQEKILPADHPDLATSYNNVGLAYGALGECGKALGYLQKALATREKVLPADHPSLATSYNNVGSTYGALGDHGKALEYKLKALLIREKVLPADHPSLATSYNNVGHTYGCLGDNTKRLEYCLKALTIREKVLPEEHPDLARSYNNAGLTYSVLGDHGKALGYQQKALAIQEKVLPADHPDLAASYDTVGSTYGVLGDHGKALEYQQKALSIREKVLPKDHPDIANSYNNVGGTYYEAGDYQSALENQQKALEIRERVLPEYHPDLAMSHHNVALDYYLLGQIQKAAKYMRRAADIINQSSLPVGHPYRVDYNRRADRLEREARQAQTAE